MKTLLKLLCGIACVLFLTIILTKLSENFLRENNPEFWEALHSQESSNL